MNTGGAMMIASARSDSRLGYWCELGNETDWIGVEESPIGLGPWKKMFEVGAGQLL
jgi:hypothetical protein